MATDTTRLDGVRVIGVDEHRWSHTRRPGEDGYVTVIIDLTPVLEGTGRARLLDLVPGRSAAALKSWLADQSQAFRDRVEVVAMDGFGGYKTAAADVVPEATAVMDPFHVVALAGAKLDLCRQRIQQQTCGHRGRTGDPLYRARRTLRTRYPLLNNRQKSRLEAVFADESHIAVELCWGFYQRLIAAYAHPDPRRGKTMMTAIIDALRTGVPAALEELAQLGRTLHRRRHDVLAYFDHHASNGPTEAINGRLEALRRNALGFRNLTHYRCAHYCTAATWPTGSMHSDSGRASKLRLGRLVVWSVVVLLVALVVVNLTVARLPEMPPADGKYISLHGKEIHYFEQPGQGVPVVMIHGQPGPTRISNLSSPNCPGCT